VTCHGLPRQHEGRLILTVLGGLAEFERELIRARTGEGRARAVANGAKMGRKPKMTEHQKREAIRRRDRGEDSLAEIGRSYNVSGWTISRPVNFLCISQKKLVGSIALTKLRSQFAASCPVSDNVKITVGDDSVITADSHVGAARQADRVIVRGEEQHERRQSATAISVADPVAESNQVLGHTCGLRFRCRCRRVDGARPTSRMPPVHPWEVGARRLRLAWQPRARRFTIERPVRMNAPQQGAKVCARRL
jgi:hypothetical protein